MNLINGVEVFSAEKRLDKQSAADLPTLAILNKNHVVLKKPISLSKRDPNFGHFENFFSSDLAILAVSALLPNFAISAIPAISASLAFLAI